MAEIYCGFCEKDVTPEDESYVLDIYDYSVLVYVKLTCPSCGMVLRDGDSEILTNHYGYER